MQKENYLNNVSYIDIYLLFYKPRNWLGKAVAWFTRSNYSHVSIHVNYKTNNKFFGNLYTNKFVIYEADYKKGVVKRKDERRDHFADAYLIKKDCEFLRKDKEKIIKFLEAQIGKKYDRQMVMRFVTRQGETPESQDRFFCGELVGAALEKGGITLFNNTEHFELSPGLMCKSLALKKV